MKSFGLAVQVLRGKVKSQEGRERREGIEVQVSTGYWLPGWVLTGIKKFQDRQNICAFVHLRYLHIQPTGGLMGSQKILRPQSPI